MFLLLTTTFLSICSADFWSEIGLLSEESNSTAALAIGSAATSVFEPLLNAWPSLPNITAIWSASDLREFEVAGLANRINLQSDDFMERNLSAAFDVVIIVPLEGSSPSNNLLRTTWFATRSILAGRFSDLREIKYLQNIADEAAEFVVEKSDSWYNWKARKRTIIRKSSCTPSLRIMKPRSGITIPVLPTSNFATVRALVNCSCCDIGPGDWGKHFLYCDFALEEGNYLVFSIGSNVETAEEENRSYFTTAVQVLIGRHTVSAKLFANGAELIISVSLLLHLKS